MKTVNVPAEPNAAMLRAALTPTRRYLPHVEEKLNAHHRMVWRRMVLAATDPKAFAAFMRHAQTLHGK